MEKTKKQLEEEIQGLNFLLLEQKDTINTLANERDKCKSLLEDIAKNIVVQANVSFNEGQQKLENKKVPEVALLFAEWLARNNYIYTRDYNMNVLWGKQVPITGARAETTEELFNRYMKAEAKSNDR